MLVPVILSGGVGARLWPVSREAYPKPFIRLADGRSLLTRTCARAAALDDVAHIITVTNREYYFATLDEYRSAGADPAHVFLLEPFGRNTAPAIALAALVAAARWGRDTELLVLPADHLIENIEAFVAATRVASTLAQEGRLVTFGIPPSRPETGFGYIECGSALGPEACAVARFIEKPPADKAAQFVASGRYLWNSGMFLFTARKLLEGLREHAPVLLAGAERCLAASPAGPDGTVTLDRATFEPLPDISLDYALMEKSADVAVVRAEFDWNDIGSWNALAELAEPDAEGNRAAGEAVMIGSHNCYVQSADRVVATVGVENLLVIDTPDALLIADKGAAQRVREVTDKLKLANHPAQRIHRTVLRPWGAYTLLEQGPGYKIKRIEVNAGAALSLQLHRHRSEHWVVISGTATVVNGDDHFVVERNESTFIPANTKHRLSNAGAEPLVIIEVQTGSYVEEDDIVRFDDVYGRA
jgi:mannose-1-phosphate guanylyltransferase/mannose-6-phosphate isomerase